MTSVNTLVTSSLSFFFFFQAEDGIRDKLVTGVQTCALPISGSRLVEEQQARLGGERHRDLQQAPVAVRERYGGIACTRGEPDGLKQPADLRVGMIERVDPAARLERGARPGGHRPCPALLPQRQPGA